MAWINDYIGLPYKWGGREWDGLDCYGLVKLVYREEYGIILPDWATDAIDLKERDGLIAAVVCGGNWEPVDEPGDRAFAVCYRHRAAHHLGLHYGRGILHCADGIGVIYEPRSHFERNYLRVEYGQWTPD